MIRDALSCLMSFTFQLDENKGMLFCRLAISFIIAFRGTSGALITNS